MKKQKPIPSEETMYVFDCGCVDYKHLKDRTATAFKVVAVFACNIVVTLRMYGSS
ncbi:MULTISPECIES: hypothetical protein [unclassified Peribacillus]|uniref:hypothetical protein n=1 Tax=unclassified Peribacillus TaxID=2675266 RepID=UPI0019136B47|nr:MULTISPECIES: hypothetical protein [unclassified Peribacillus]MBK5446181.1 hypothetical protein [Peribacillus sp. TH24]MBK5459149.1 hypothetical protein [Peribacillus sp. TH27]MBK5502514.1 hypothetical protein [Peribacillus sp. TH14]WMX57567.1 hypothetical protein RE409_10295 [Peribacillus sp. R9-11]